MDRLNSSVLLFCFQHVHEQTAGEMRDCELDPSQKGPNNLQRNKEKRAQITCDTRTISDFTINAHLCNAHCHREVQHQKIRSATTQYEEFAALVLHFLTQQAGLS